VLSAVTATTVKDSVAIVARAARQDSRNRHRRRGAADRDRACRQDAELAAESEDPGRYDTEADGEEHRSHDSGDRRHAQLHDLRDGDLCPEQPDRQPEQRFRRELDARNRPRARLGQKVERAQPAKPVGDAILAS
jgi:hypothetical protein